jgi:hypothetical protein
MLTLCLKPHREDVHGVDRAVDDLEAEVLRNLVGQTELVEECGPVDVDGVTAFQDGVVAVVEGDEIHAGVTARELVGSLGVLNAPEPVLGVFSGQEHLAGALGLLAEAAEDLASLELQLRVLWAEAAGLEEG